MTEVSEEMVEAAFDAAMDAVILPIEGHPKDGVRLSDYLDFTAADAVELGVTLVHTGKDGKPSFHWYSDIAGDERKDAERAIFDRPIRAALTDALAARPKATHRHKERGSEYVLMGFGKMQCDWWQITGQGFRYPVDMREVAIYRSVDDGALWVRPREEFEDGRFSALEDGQ